MNGFGTMAPGAPGALGLQLLKQIQALQAANAGGATPGAPPASAVQAQGSPVVAGPGGAAPAPGATPAMPGAPNFVNKGLIGRLAAGNQGGLIDAIMKRMQPQPGQPGQQPGQPPLDPSMMGGGQPLPAPPGQGDMPFQAGGLGMLSGW